MDRTAVVTGASGGIGAAVARALAADGDDVVVSSRDADDLEGVVADCESEGARATAMRADVRDEFDVERLMESASRFGGGVDLVVPCAAVYHGRAGRTPIDEASYSAFDDHLRTNARGVFAAIREALPHMPAEARVLVPTGSVASDPREGVGTYAVSKAAAEAVARQFAVDAPQAVGCVDPGHVNTGLSTGGRDPADVAGLFVWAAGVEADRLNGAVLTLDDWEDATD